MSTQHLPCGSDEILSKRNGSRCCKLCKEGYFMVAECDQNNTTKCQPCEDDHYMDKSNFLEKCKPCKKCPANSFLEVESECKAERDRQCKCKEGYYCLEKECDHCRPAKKCPTGQGVKAKHTSKSDTVCVPCASGEYSNVTDLYAPCLKHTDCESLGWKLVTHGTNTTDAKCTPSPDTGCLWMVPASLWVGFVATVLVVIIVYAYRRRSRRCRAQITGAYEMLRECPSPSPATPPDPARSASFSYLLRLPAHREAGSLITNSARKRPALPNAML